MPNKDGYLTWADFKGTAPKFKGLKIKLIDVDTCYVSINNEWKKIKSFDEIENKEKELKK